MVDHQLDMVACCWSSDVKTRRMMVVLLALFIVILTGWELFSWTKLMK